jgi:hypothetical protein
VKDLKRFSTLSLAIILLTSTIAIFNMKTDVATAQPPTGPYISIEPTQLEFGPAPCVGQEFDVTIWAHNFDQWPASMQGIEVHVLIDMEPGYLEDVAFTNLLGRTGGFFEGRLTDILYGISPGWYGTRGVDRTYKVAAAVSGVGWNAIPHAKIAELKLKIVNQKWWYQGTGAVDVPIAITFTEVYDENVNLVDHDLYKNWGTWKGAKVTIYDRNPEPLPQIQVVETGGTSTITKGGTKFDINSTFTVDVKLYDLTNYSQGGNSPAGLYGYELLLTWNETLLELLHAENITDPHGGVLNEPVWGWTNITENSYRIVMTSLYPAEPWFGTNKPMVRLTFKIIKQGVAPPTPAQSCQLKLEYTDLVIVPSDWPYAVSIPHERYNATYTILPYPGTINHPVTVGTNTYYVTTQSTTVVIGPTNLNFNPPPNPKIQFYVILSDQIDPDVTVTIPKNFMWCDTLAQWVIKINGTPVTPTDIDEDTANTYITITLDPATLGMGTHLVEIGSTHAVAEIPTTYLTPILTLMMLIAIATATAWTKKRRGHSIAK